MRDVLAALRGGLIVSVQAPHGSALDDPYAIAAMARAAVEAGAVGLRIEGVANLAAVCERASVPVIGLIKVAYPGFEPYITPTLREVDAVVLAGAQIVAFDATQRARPEAGGVAELTARIHAAGRLAMADCATERDGVAALAAGADIVGTTLCGYTSDTTGHSLPALDLVETFARLGGFTICEGGVASPAQLRVALDAGADAVVVGTAITGIDALVRRFAGSADNVTNG